MTNSFQNICPELKDRLVPIGILRGTLVVLWCVRAKSTDSGFVDGGGRHVILLFLRCWCLASLAWVSASSCCLDWQNHDDFPVTFLISLPLLPTCSGLLRGEPPLSSSLSFLPYPVVSASGHCLIQFLWKLPLFRSLLHSLMALSTDVTCWYSYISGDIHIQQYQLLLLWCCWSPH